MYFQTSPILPQLSGGLGFGAAAHTEDYYTGTSVPKYKSFQRPLDYPKLPWAPDATIDELDWLMAYHITGDIEWPTELYLQSLAGANKGGPQLFQWLADHCEGQWVVLFYDVQNKGAGSYLRMFGPNDIRYFMATTRPGYMALLVKKPDLSAPAYQDAARYSSVDLVVAPTDQRPWDSPPTISFPPDSNDLLPQIVSVGDPVKAAISSAGILLVVAACVGGYLLLKRNGAFEGAR